MLELTVAKIRRWGQRIGVDILRYAELDYWLTEWLAAISRDDWLAERLDFKGGTALNKVYLGDQGRLSVDLDFNSRGDKDDVQESRPAVLERLEGLAHGLDSGAEISRKNDAWEMFGLAASFQPITGGPPLKVKVEISTIDRFSVFPRREETLETPESGRVAVATLRPDELVATKLHAVYARRKGRDVFDLERAVPLLQDRMSVRRMAALYFMRRGTVYDPERVLHSVEAADAADRVREDVDELIRADAVFDAEKAVAAVRREYRFLASLEPVERDFLAGARYWLGDLGAARAGAPKDWGHPLARLFEGTADVTAEAREATWDSLRVFGKEPIN